MSNYKISLSPLPQKTEYSGRTLEIMDTFTSENPQTITMENFKAVVKQIGTEGHAFCPTTFKGGIKGSDTFEQSQFIVLSFDSFSTLENRSLTFKDMMSRAKRCNIPLVFAYDSFSPTLQRKKFVMGFLNDTPFDTIREAETAYAALKMIFPEADKNSSPLKLYQGGKHLFYIDDSLPKTNTYSLLMNMSLWLKKRYGDTNYKKRHLAEFCKKTGIVLKDSGFPSVTLTEDLRDPSIEQLCSSSTKNKNNTRDDKNMTKRIIESSFVKELSKFSYKIQFISDSSTISDHLENQLPAQSKNHSYSSYRSNDLKNLSSSCKLYREFLSAEKLLSEKELLGLASNIVKIRGGATSFKNTLKSTNYFNKEEETLSNWAFYLSYIKDDDPLPCEAFCPFHGICPHGKTVLSTLKPQKHNMEKIANWGNQLVSLKEAEEDFKKTFRNAIKATELGWYIIKSQTALGKTETMLCYLKDTNLKVLIVVPTNKLKREVCDRAEKMGITVIVSPSLHEIADLLPDHVWSAIQSYYSEGKSPMPYIRKLIEENDPECSKLLKKYLRELSEFNNADGHAITTHRRLASVDLSKYDLVIIDEDILYSTVIPSRETIAISDLKKIKKQLPDRDPLAVKIKSILKSRNISKYFTLRDVDYSRTYASIKVAANIPALCSARYFCFRSSSDYNEDLEEDSITFINPVVFPKMKKYIMLSASADRDICEYYLGEECTQFYECKEARIAGTLNLFSDKPMGRNSLRKAPSTFTQIKKWTGFPYTISFKEFHDYYEGDRHFGNCAGCDFLKGQNIDVIGTPHQPWWVYELFAYSLGFDVDVRPNPNTVAEYNGFRFPFYTYKDRSLQNIQFYMIASELEQAVGRARLLRCDCTVNVFSDFPVRQAELCVSEYDT